MVYYINKRTQLIFFKILLIGVDILMFNPIRGWSVFVYFPRLRRGLFKLNPSRVLIRKNLENIIGVFWTSVNVQSILYPIGISKVINIR
jgi:hypothetical protein